MNRKSYFAQETFVLQSKATVEPVFVTKFFQPVVGLRNHATTLATHTFLYRPGAPVFVLMF